MLFFIRKQGTRLNSPKLSGLTNPVCKSFFLPNLYCSLVDTCNIIWFLIFPVINCVPGQPEPLVIFKLNDQSIPFSWQVL
ncbi:hypothetical protein A8C56_07745 [Niabella ginsenosidivorans]|uniref:Uncharacterized protein n=1 Tax=Niabella ginsenosidivorans TaxID=1176587 RepID=A0A1A9I0N1_9BACT|nr:hypothetical protein A8C56_07745 [Niabella ginsenosidivorans]